MISRRQLLSSLSNGLLAVLSVVCFLRVVMDRQKESSGNIVRRIESPKELLQWSTRNLVQGAKLELENTQVLDTAYTSAEMVLKHGFPSNWHPCTLQNILDKPQKKALKVVVLGGSASAYSGQNCTIPGQALGRYSNVLQSTLNNFTQGSSSPIEFEVTNMAHGGLGSVFHALLMDSFVDPLETDLIIWEFAINDGPRGKWASGDKIDLFFRRVHHLFASVGRQPPPILLVYLWDYKTAKRKPEIIRAQGVGTGAYQLQLDTIEKYQSLGWNLQVLTVGTTLDLDAVADNVRLVFDDGHHAACNGLHLISNMIARAIYKDLYTCGEQVRPSNRTVANIDRASEQGVEPFMFQNGTRIGSLACSPPNAGTSKLHVKLSAETEKAVVDAGKSSPTREDRFLVWDVPRCGNGTLEFSILEPNLRWLALGCGYGCTHATWLNLRINNKKLALSENGDELLSIGSEYVQVWADVSAAVVPRASQYNVSLCGPRFGLRFLVGLVQDP